MESADRRLRPAQRLPVRIWNRLAEAWGGDRAPRTLSVESLRAEAMKRTGLCDFGDASFVEPFERLVDSLNASARLHPFGAFSTRVLLARLLDNRLRIEEEWKLSAVEREIRIRRPLFIVGLPRTGTTHLVNLLACDPGFRFLSHWEAICPVPARGWGRKRPARRASGAVALAVVNYFVPDLKVIHPTRLDGPEECVPLLMNSFAFQGFASTFNVPEYVTWLADHDWGPAMRYHARQLALLQAQRGAGRWLLKCPAHLATIDALMQVYPDACILQTHRDPLKVLPSECSLFAAFRSLFTAQIDAVELGRQVTDVLARDLQRFSAARKRYDPRRFCDVQYSDLVRDPLDVVWSVYDHFGLSLPGEVEAAMRKEVAASPKDKRGVHRYALSDFGLDAGSLHERFDSYCAEYGVAREAGKSRALR